MNDTANQAPKQRTSFTANAALLSEAKALGVNVSRAAEAGIAEAVRRARWAKWRAENAEAIRSSNEYVEEHGLPLAKYRQF